MRIEEKIRDYLANNLGFISGNLTLIDKEFYLNALVGSNGYIDILAKDNFNNYVIIEIKRSESAARQTLNELLKYKGLLKQIHGAQESEIKLVIISTSWDELIVPYSEIFNSVYITGYKIELGINDIPISIHKVDPRNIELLERQLSPTHSFDLFFEKDKRDSFVITISDRLKLLGIKDFVVAKLKSNGRNQQIIYPYSSYLAFQRQAESKYYELVPDLNDELEGVEFDSQEHRLSYIESLVLEQLEAFNLHDTAEYGSPNNFLSVLNIGNWEIEEIVKFGFFASDPRINDDLIINEIKGYDGANECKYFDSADSENFKKLQKVQTNLNKSLSWNKILTKHITSIFSYLNQLNRPFNVIVDIFYPHSIFDAIWRYYDTKDPNYMPFYNICVIFRDSNEMLNFHGESAWDGKPVNSDKVLAKLTEDDPFTSFMFSIAGSNDKELLNLMNISFVNEIQTIANGKYASHKNIKFRKNTIISDNLNYLGYGSFFDDNQDLMQCINLLYQECTTSSTNPSSLHLL